MARSGASGASSDNCLTLLIERVYFSRSTSIVFPNTEVHCDLPLLRRLWLVHMHKEAFLFVCDVNDCIEFVQGLNISDLWLIAQVSDASIASLIPSSLAYNAEIYSQATQEKTF